MQRVDRKHCLSPQCFRNARESEAACPTPTGHATLREGHYPETRRRRKRDASQCRIDRRVVGVMLVDIHCLQLLHASYPNAVESGKPSSARPSCGLARPPRKEGVRSRDVFRIALLAVFE